MGKPDLFTVILLTILAFLTFRLESSKLCASYRVFRFNTRLSV